MAEFKTVYVVQGRMSSGPDDKTEFTDASHYRPFKTQYEAMVALEELRKSASDTEHPRMVLLAALSNIIKLKLETRIVKRTISEEVVDDVHAQALGEK